MTIATLPTGRRLAVVLRPPPERDRFIPGDRLLKPIARRLLRRPQRPTGLKQVAANLRLALTRLGVPHIFNPKPRQLRAEDWLLTLGIGRDCLAGIPVDRPMVAGIGMMGHPAEWPELAADPRVRLFLQHSRWACDLYRPWFADRCREWPIGIDTEHWTAPTARQPPESILIYRKFLWQQERLDQELLYPIRAELDRRGLAHQTISYGSYEPEAYRQQLQRCSAMIFLSAHESQGLAYQEAMACDVPILAWDPGQSMDPERFRYGTPVIATTSVPYFDSRCGLRFADRQAFTTALDAFLSHRREQRFAPRAYVLEHLSLQASTDRLLRLMNEVMPT